MSGTRSHKFDAGVVTKDLFRARSQPELLKNYVSKVFMLQDRDNLLYRGARSVWEITPHLLSLSFRYCNLKPIPTIATTITRYIRSQLLILL